MTNTLNARAPADKNLPAGRPASLAWQRRYRGVGVITRPLPTQPRRRGCITPVMNIAVSNRVISQLLRMARLNCWTVSDYGVLEELMNC